MSTRCHADLVQNNGWLAKYCCLNIIGKPVKIMTTGRIRFQTIEMEWSASFLLWLCSDCNPSICPPHHALTITHLRSLAHHVDLMENSKRFAQNPMLRIVVMKNRSRRLTEKLWWKRRHDANSIQPPSQLCRCVIVAASLAEGGDVAEE